MITKRHIDQLRFQVLWSFTRNGAFSRSRIYNDDININKIEKAKFKNFVKDFLLNDVYQAYLNDSITEEKLIKLIDNFIMRTNKSFKGIFKSGKEILYGHAQKIINLFLKGMWINGWLKKPPPHFPVDRIIQKKLKRPIYNWTKMDKIAYLKVIEKAKEKAGANVKLAEWEAITYLEI